MSLRRRYSILVRVKPKIMSSFFWPLRDWKTLQGFVTKEARDRKLEQLRKSRPMGENVWEYKAKDLRA